MSTTAIQVSTDALVPMPLACDPAIRRENSIEAIVDLLTTSSAEGLTIPPDATIVVLHPLERAALRKCEEAAGRLPARGEQAHARVERKASDRIAAERIAEKIAAARLAMNRARDEALAATGRPAEGDPPEVIIAKLTAVREAMQAAMMPHARAMAELQARQSEIGAEELDALTPEEFARRLEFLAWAGRRDAEVARKAVVRVERHEPAGEGVEWHALDVTHEEAVAEIAMHVRRMSELGFTGPRSYGISRGRPTSAPASDGSARTAASDPTCASSEAPAADSSDTTSQAA